MKTISIILILSLLHFSIGCQTHRKPSIPSMEEDDIKAYIATGERLNIMTKDSINYFFNSGTYQIVNDTLSGSGQRIIEDTLKDPEQLKIAIHDISRIQFDQIQMEEKRAKITPLTIGIVVVIGILATYGIYKMLTAFGSEK